MQTTLAYHLWRRLNDGRLPHDSRQLPREFIEWTCPQCDRDGFEGECNVDWRWPLHESRYVAALEEVGIDAFQIVETDEEDTMEL
jgi:hypothetical protein